MNELPYEFAALAVLLAAQGFVMIYSRWPLRRRVAGLLLTTLAVVASYVGISDLLSRAKPVAWEFAIDDIEELEVAYADLVPGNAIHLVLRIPNVAEPRLYALPWRDDLARELEQAMATAEAEEVPLRTSPDLFEVDLEDRERLFYATPVAALPPKDQQRFDPAPFTPSDATTMYGAGGDTDEVPPE